MPKSRIKKKKWTHRRSLRAQKQDQEEETVTWEESTCPKVSSRRRNGQVGGVYVPKCRIKKKKQSRRGGLRVQKQVDIAKSVAFKGDRRQNEGRRRFHSSRS